MSDEGRSPRILLTGADGQLGKAIRRSAGERNAMLIPLSRKELDITDRERVREAVRHHAPSHIINAAAYTAVDRAESEPEQAYAVNRDGAAWLAEAAQANGCHLLHVSTDFVFDGKQSRAYKPEDTPNPINVYGASKLAGERAVLDTTHGQALILRTAWVYSQDGKNFLTTMLRLMRERDEIQVVEDQIGTPTSAASLADVLLRAVDANLSGTHHWTDAGVASWYDFAFAIQHEAVQYALLPRSVPIYAIGSEAYPTPALRPTLSLLDRRSLVKALDRSPTSWQQMLCMELSAIAALETNATAEARPKR